MTSHLSWTLHPINDFSNYHKQWDDLNNNNTNSALLEARFMQALIDNFSTSQEKIALAKKGKECLAICIIEKLGLGKWQSFQPSQAPIGAWVQQKNCNQVLLLKALSDQLDGITLIFGITQQDPDLIARPTESNHISTLDYIETARVSVTGTFDEYWSKRGKNLRQNLRRQRNRLERENVKVELNAITNPNDIHSAVKQYGELESSSWKNDEGTAVNINNRQGKFYVQLLKAYCNTNNGYIYQYKYNEKLVATDLCISRNDTIIILKTTFDEVIKTSSPAMLMRQDIFKRIFSNQSFKVIEFYGKVMDWHTKWTNEMRKMYHVNCYKYPLVKILKNLK